MANTTETDEKSAGKAEKRDARQKRQAERAEKQAGRPARLCTLSTVEVKKDDEGYQITIHGHSSEGRRRHFVLTPQEVGPVLRDLETAIQVIRGQL
jgi:hypothetical protein